MWIVRVQILVILYITTAKHKYMPVVIVGYYYHTQDDYKQLIEHTLPQPAVGSFYSVFLLSLSTAYKQLKQHP